MCGSTQSLDHQTAIEWRIKHALYLIDYNIHNLSGPPVSHEGKPYTLKQFETIALTRQSNDVNRNHIDLGKDMLVLDQTKVFLDLW